MQIKYLQHHEIDRAKWDDCISHATNSLIYALSWYLDVVSPQWEAIVAVENSGYTICFPLPVRKKLGIKYIYHPYHCQQLGFFYKNTPDQTLITQMMQVLFKHHFYIPRLSLNTNNTLALPFHKNLIVSNYTTHLLSLHQSYTYIRKNYKHDRKYRLNQAQKRGLCIVESDDIDPLISIFKEDTERRIPGEGQDPNYTLLRNLFEAVKTNAKYELYYVQNKKGQYNCGCWFVFYKNTIIHLFNAATAEARNENGRTLIIDFVIRKYQESNYILDFESSKKEMGFFDASFGSIPTPYYHIYYNNTPTFIRQLHKAKIRAHRQLLRWLYPDITLPDIRLP